MSEPNDNSAGTERRETTAKRHGAPPNKRPDVFSDDYELPTDGTSVVKEFDLGGSVPRSNPKGDGYRTEDVYIRLENTIYGPLNREELTGLLTSGQFTGYESASTDLQHWTPLLYHPRMNLTGQADPDRTHALLHQHSTLPQVSQNPSRIRLEDLTDEAIDDMSPAMPLAAILIKKKRLRPGGELEDVNEIVERSRPGAVRTTLAETPHPDGDEIPFELDLPIFGNLDEESVDDMIERHLHAEPPPIPRAAMAAVPHAATATAPPEPRPASPPPTSDAAGPNSESTGGSKRTQLLTPVRAIDIFSDTVRGLTDEHDTVGGEDELDDVVEEFAYADASAALATADAMSEPDMLFAATIDAPIVDEKYDTTTRKRPVALMVVLALLVLVALVMGAFIMFGGRG